MTTSPSLRLVDHPAGPVVNRINFTVKALHRIACPPGRRDIHVYDAKTPGLAFRITSNNARAFYLYRRVAGRPTRLRLGGASELTIEQARRKAAKLNGEIAGGSDPTALKRAQRRSETLQELFDRWFAEHAEVRLAARTRITDKSRFDTCLDGLASKRVLSITEADVRALHLVLGRERGQVTANRAVQLVRRLFNWARLERNPASRAVTMFRESSRTRFVRPDEMRRLFAALNDPAVSCTWRDYFYTVLYTGQRRSAVASMHVRDIDLARNVWTVPASASKNHEPIAVPLTDQAMQIIQNRPGDESGFIFPAASASGHLEEPGIAWRKIRQAAGLPDVTIHDLRRTYGSYQAALGASLPIIGASLGHRDAAATQVYSRLDLEPVRASVTAGVNAIEQAGRGVAAPTPGKRGKR